MRVGLLTGGGDCPGLNAVIRALTKSLIHQCQAEVLGIEDGFAGLMDMRTRRLDWKAVSGILATGGTILGTSNRCNPMQTQETSDRALANAAALGLDALVVVGGDGSMAIADGLAQQGLSVVGVPKTIDNDIAGCERSFGFDTAVAIVTEALERVQTTGQSHGRVMIVECMGRYAGWVALQAGIAGAADLILLPEIDYALETVVRVCHEREQLQRFSVICIGEGAKERGAAPSVAQRVCDSPDPVRLGGIAHRLRDQLQPRLRSEVRSTVLGHVQRGGPPTANDRVLATQFGNMAARLVQDGNFGRMVTLAGGQIGSVALHSVAGHNRLLVADDALLRTARQIGIYFGDEA